MKLKILFYLLLVGIYFLFNSCEYSPTEINYVKLDSNFKSANIFIKTTPIEDTLRFHDDVRITFALEEETSISSFILILDSKEIYSSLISHGEYTITSSMLNKSINRHDLEIVAYKNSETGSLADRAGLEGTFAVKKWVLIYQ